MAYIPNSQKITKVEELLEQHTKLLIKQNEELNNQKNITLFFTIIVAITLVATLAGLVGLYISAFNAKSSDTTLLEKNTMSLVTEIGQIRSDLQILKARNSYLK